MDVLRALSRNLARWRQADQDRVLEYIFHHIGVTNKFFVEFGFNTASFEAGGSGPNTAALYTAFGWRGLLLDGMHRNDTINLHTEFISPDNIVELFDKYSVPAEPDYVSIDIDSTDVWIFRELLASGRYRPRVFTVEYNANFPLESTVTWPREGRDTPWQGNKVMGSAFGAIKAVGDEFGYSIVWVVPYLDIFFVRDDILDGVTSIHPTHFWASATSLPVHSPAPEHEVHELMEYHTWLKTHDAAKARAAAQEQLREMDIVLTA
ncbi:hypothetical protein WJX72_010096 [[Myrmecia] bisecta]|uniref:Uncharacterized protein n=1 Tax=[Myrmecia] bisecta TaxID=41462 RepID=A0AAW1PG92_9CHLO